MVGYVIGEDTGVGAHDSHWQSKHAEIRLQLLVSRGVADNGYGICAKLASDRIYSPPDQLVTGWMAVERGTKPYLQAPAMDSPQQGGAAPRSRPESLRR